MRKTYTSKVLLFYELTVTSLIKHRLKEKKKIKKKRLFVGLHCPLKLTIIYILLTYIELVATQKES